ncbi:MAG: RNA methyltransferase [Cyclobacteriaceae bacterium]|tara:strand:- start:84616 stop:85146 length:531 start_codon:yes stop_codon:yes gene_type:complete
MRKLKNEELGRISVEEFKEAKKSNVCIILDDVRSLNNVGSVFRTSDAFMIEKVWLCGITGKPPHRDIQKTALGATESVEWEHRREILPLIDELRSNGYVIISVEQADKSVSLKDFEPLEKSKYALVFGNEVFGVKDEVVKKSDVVLEIPQQGTKHSLNISVSVGVVIWDFVSKLGT